MSDDTNQDTQPEVEIPEQQTAEDTSIWEDKITLSPDGTKHIRTDESVED
ncbi:MAG: hypothetical protein WAQ24_05715 [Candidatus Saccharimonadales bacterium]